MKRSELNPLPEYFDRYILKCDDEELLDVLANSSNELHKIPLAEWNKIGSRVYAPGKWSIADILQHLIDTERIFTYRALAIARGETQKLPSFDENAYAIEAKGSSRSLPSLLDELRLSHQNFRAMYATFTPDILLRRGPSFKGTYSVAEIGFIAAGHQRWHLEVIQEKYLPLAG